MQTIYPLSFVQSRQRARMALALILAAESLLFGLLIVSFLFERATHPVWNPALPLQFRLIFPGINTLLLLVSAGLARQSLSALKASRKFSFFTFEAGTLGVGLVFVAAQIFEFSHSGKPVQAPEGFGGVFFALMGFHALHLLAGVTLLALNILRIGTGKIRLADVLAVEVSTWFWYYVTLVWVLLFVILYRL